MLLLLDLFKVTTTKLSFSLGRARVRGKFATRSNVRISLKNRGLEAYPMLRYPHDSAKNRKKNWRELREARRTDFGVGPCIVITMSGDVDITLTGNEIDHRDFVVGLDGHGKGEVHRRAKPVIAAVLAAVTMAADKPVTLKKVSERTVFYREDCKPLFLFEFQGSANGYVSSPMTPAACDLAGTLYSRMVGNPALERVVRLLTTSIQAEGDMLRPRFSLHGTPWKSS